MAPPSLYSRTAISTFRLASYSRPRLESTRATTPVPTTLATPTTPTSPPHEIPPLRQPSPPNHHDLHSFLKYADRIKLNRKSPTFVGTHYEYVVLAGLARYGFLLRRVGGVSDFGIDLLGTWNPPTTALRARTIIQCKAGPNLSGPRTIRELEGAFIGAPPAWQGPGVLAFLVAESAATQGARDALSRSRWPMGFIRSSADGQVTQMIWNQAAAAETEIGHLDIGLSYGTSGNRIALIHQGTILPTLDPDADHSPGE